MYSKFLRTLITFIIGFSLGVPVTPSYAAGNLLGLPEPGTMIYLSPAYEPVLIKGLKVHPENPFLFDFIVDTGNSKPGDLRPETAKLIKYFLAALTIPEKDLWVNLSPYEKNRMIAANLGQTVMGRDMLAQDYVLKQLTASLIYPEKDLGKIFWDDVYSKAQLLYGTTQIPVNTFNKVWIVADKADVYERDNVAYVVGAHLKVMLEEDYLALSHHSSPDKTTSSHSVASQVVRQVILPELEHEVNQDKNFASLRQMFYSMILATWYKMALKNAILTQVYGNQSKVKVGVNQDDPRVNQLIFERYLKAYKKGVFNYIKEEDLKDSDAPVARKYFSGGTQFAMLPTLLNRIRDPSQMPKGDSLGASGRLWDAASIVDPAQNSTKKEKQPAAIKRHKNYVKTVVLLNKKKNDKGIPEIRMTRISTLTVGPDQEKYFFRAISKNKAIVMLTEEGFKEAVGLVGTNRKMLLTNQKGSIPYKYLDAKVSISPSVKELADYFTEADLPEDFDFKDLPKSLPRELEKKKFVAVKVNEIHRIIVHDRINDRYLSFLVFNKRDLENNKRQLNGLGGRVRWKRGGFKFYQKNVDPQLEDIASEKGDIKLKVQGKNLRKLLQYLHQGIGIEDNVDDEIISELDSENGTFPETKIPAEWLVHSNRAMAVNITGLKLFVTPQGQRTEVDVVFPDGAQNDPKIKDLINRMKGLSLNFSMTSNDGKPSWRMRFNVMEQWRKISESLEFIPWERYSGQALFLGGLLYLPAALLFHFRDTSSALGNTLEALILALILWEHGERNFALNHDYYLRLIKNYYDKGAFSNGHSSQEVIKFYRRFYEDFSKYLNDDQEEKTLELIAGTMTGQEINDLSKKKYKGKFEDRLLWAIEKRNENRAEFLKRHRTYLTQLDPSTRTRKVTKAFIMRALQFYNQFDRQFWYYLPSPEREKVAEFVAKELPESQRTNIFNMGKNQPSTFQEMVYWDLPPEKGDEEGVSTARTEKVVVPMTGLETAEKNDQTTAAAAMSNQPRADNGGIDLNSGNMQLNLHGQAPHIYFNPAMINRLRTEGYDGFEFNIRSIVPTNFSLLGFETSPHQVLN